MSTLCFNRSSISSFNEHNSISDPFGGEGKIEEGLIPAYFFEKSVHVCTYIYIYICVCIFILILEMETMRKIHTHVFVLIRLD